jgi:hypothetical protein
MPTARILRCQCDRRPWLLADGFHLREASMDAVRMLERGLGTDAKATLVDKCALDRNHRIDRKGSKDVFMFNFI